MPRLTDEARNAAFLRDWDRAPIGKRFVIAFRYGFKSVNSAKVVASNLRRHGKTNTRGLKKPVSTD